MNIGKRVRLRRKELGMTQVELASRAGITQSTLSSIENGDTSTPLGANLLRLAAALECSPNWLQTGKGSVTIQATDTTVSELNALVGGLDDQQKATLLAVANTLFK